MKCGDVLSASAAFCENCGSPVGAGNRLLCHVDDEGAVNVGGLPSATSSVREHVDTKVIGEVATSATHRGRRHRDNQDSVAIARFAYGVALAVADGVSTSARARDAADAAVQVALEVLGASHSCDDEVMLAAASSAHEAICRLPYEPDPDLAEPQATIVLALVQGDQVRYAWVGDSRLYLVTDQDAIALTDDDSWLNEQVKSGVPLSTAMKDVNAHCITQCLGMRDASPEIHVGAAHVPEGSRLVLCSDGLWNYLDSADTLLTLMRSRGTVDTLEEQAVRLVDFANASGGQDNVTVALYRA
ncbi:PP2C family protein-serine/threonine phosphatase [Trinickia fusca]|uniref:PPM-type phosphatase domain-containing protein n=1 Tax=Trinickia fusca TaxID=2419777 RepID=A0A494XSL1_9BURK|nr:PP2C family serine/threonine-protein phosphatase [Trinickia fusca]RKP50533.1 hypothetical protein D7S89_05350 [Trinickia fusca]